MNNSYIYIYHVNVTQTVPDISPLMPMHQDPLLVLDEILDELTINIFLDASSYIVQPARNLF